ncbi:hypothetical protein CYY_007849 [Polysphondylium violaceum]|uniref:Uncharacterized protein n=1 Tax=Polysphondylium violaceum TaxID=133409 RepID=A0A8J4PMV4_9MYCE|nr:hypothetical protein CYY_007849 [Polysphondylium violaceum]
MCPIKIKPENLQFDKKKQNNKVEFMITNDGFDLVDLEVNLLSNDSDISKKITIPDIRGSAIICEQNKPAIIPINPQEHMLFYVIYKGENDEKSCHSQSTIPTNNLGKSNTEIELKYTDETGHRNRISVPINVE